MNLRWGPKLLNWGMNMDSNHLFALLIIDVQQGFEDKRWGKRNNLNAEENINSLLKIWREKAMAYYPCPTYINEFSFSSSC